MRNDDRPVGRVLTRREALKLLGMAGAGLLVGLRPEAEAQVPPRLDASLERSDIRADTATGVIKQGVPLALTIGVKAATAAGPAPVQQATVELWQCDASGSYAPTALRGWQTTDANGVVRFRTIFPGWHDGRTVHVNMNVRATAADGRAYRFTSPLFFDDGFSDRLFAGDGRYRRPSGRSVRNSGDADFQRSAGQLTLAPTRTRDGYAAGIDLVLDLRAGAG